MAWEPSDSVKRFLKESGSTYRTFTRTEVFAPSPVAGAPPIIVSPSAVVCEVIDMTTGKVYAKAEAPGEPEALEAAVAVAETAEKPLTPAQERDRLRARMGSVATENNELKKGVAEKDSAIAALTSRVAALAAQIQAMQKPTEPKQQSEPQSTKSAGKQSRDA